MKCISCAGELESREVQQGLRAEVCNQCEGVWLDLVNYQRWQKKSALTVQDDDVSAFNHPLPIEAGEVIESSPTALFCPECSSLLQKYRLSANLPARIDRCLPCSKVWLDAAEWQLVCQQPTTTNLVQVLSDQGQRQIRTTETRERMVAIYQQRFGEADYAQIEQMRTWLAVHPQKSQLLAYLSASDPYSAIDK